MHRMRSVVLQRTFVFSPDAAASSAMPLVPFVVLYHGCGRTSASAGCGKTRCLLVSSFVELVLDIFRKKRSSQMFKSSQVKFKLAVADAPPFGALAGATRERSGVSASHARLFGACRCVSGREGPETIERRLEEGRTLRYCNIRPDATFTCVTWSRPLRSRYPLYPRTSTRRTFLPNPFKTRPSSSTFVVRS